MTSHGVEAGQEIVVHARDLTKFYRLYSRPHYRFLDFFGLLRRTKGAYTEHAAIERVSLDVRRGEKVAIIGRNGAGKSTLLKLVTRVTRPSSGRLDVRGQVHALLQIGTGFHPDFTGRQNVQAYLAQLGVTGKQAEDKIDEVIAFSELEEYIDQPAKTYSTGMSARLMFSTSTAISPDILVLDEVLSVGDAYFTHKSYERIRELCQGSGTTLLLVTHDIYSALRIASRFVWLDRGRVLMDGDGPTVVNAYEDSIRLQEEQRLRLRKQQSLRRSRLIGQWSARFLIVELQARQGRPQPSPVEFSRIALLAGDVVVAELPLGAGAFENEAGSHLQREACCWGEAVEQNGRTCRPLLNYGSPFHKVAGVFVYSPATVGAQDQILVEYRSELPCELVVSVFDEGREVYLGALPPSDGQWRQHSLWLPAAGSAVNVDGREPATGGVQGTGAIQLRSFAMIDGDGRETHFVRHGSPVAFQMDYVIADPRLCERAQVILAFHTEAGQTACRVLTRDLLFDAASKREGTIQLRLPRMPLGNGSYTVTTLVAREGYFDQEQPVFYSLNPGVYCSLSRFVEIGVTGNGLVENGTIFVAEGAWSLLAHEAGARTADRAPCG